MNDLKIQITGRGLSSYIRFIDYDKKATLNDIYNSYDIIMLLSQYEGFGLPVLEAQVYNIPVICSDIAVFKEILGESAFYVPRVLSDDFIVEIIDLLGDNKKLEYLRLMGKANVNKYSWRKMSIESYSLYSRLLSVVN